MSQLCSSQVYWALEETGHSSWALLGPCDQAELAPGPRSLEDTWSSG